MTDPEKLDELEARLRAVESSSTRSEVSTNWHRNPDGPEAADAIHTLRERNAALVEGLRPFAELADEAEDSASALQCDRDDFYVTQIGGYKVGDLHLEDFLRARTTLAALKETDNG